MDCDEAMVLISARMDGEMDHEIDPGQQARLTAHLAECPACTALSEALPLQDAELRRGFEPRRRRADAVADRVLAQLHAASPSPARAESSVAGTGTKMSRRFTAPRVALALFAVAALIGMVGWLNHPDGRSVSSGESVVKVDAPANPPAVETISVRPRIVRPGADSLAIGAELKTKAGDRRRVVLPDDSILLVNQNTSLMLTADRRVRLNAGEIYVEVASNSPASDFFVETPKRSAAAMGTRFAVQASDAGTGVFVAQGKVQVSGLDQPLEVGQQLAPGAERVTAAPRASFLLDWTRDLLAGESIIPKSDHSGGALVVVDASGKDTRLSLRKSHIDVHIEDGFARTTIDQTYFNHNPARLEGTFYFPLPADASLSRLAMYVANGNECTLNEGGMVERDYGRTVFESIMTKMKDPALLEWVDGSTFKMRVFPLEGRQEKRIILSYTQKLDSLYGSASYRFPSGHSLQAVGDWSFHARIRGGARSAWNSPSHELTVSYDGDDLLLDAQARNANLDRDVCVKFGDGSKAGAEARFSSAEHDGARYLMLRYRPELAAIRNPQSAIRNRKDWVFLFESSGDRDPILARTQIEIIEGLLANAGRDDTFVVLEAGTRVQKFAPTARPVNRENIDAAVAFLENTRLIGALDLEQALTASRAELARLKNPYLVHVGSGIAVLGERKEDVLAKNLPDSIPYVGVGVGKRWSRSFMKLAADRTGGAFVQINPDEPVAWRAFELSSLLDVPRLVNVQVVDNAERVKFLGCTTTLAEGEELCAIARIDPDGRAEGVSPPWPESITVAGTLNGKPFEQVFRVEKVAPNAGYLPRTWARLEVDRLLAEDRVKHKDRIVALSKAMYVMTPFTSLLVLENEAMYAQYNVDRGRKDHWAMYPCPAKIPTVYEPEPALVQIERIKQEYEKDLAAMRFAKARAETAMAATKAEVEKQIQGIDANYREVVKKFEENIINAEKYEVELAALQKQKHEVQSKLEAALKEAELKIKKLDQRPAPEQVLQTLVVRMPSDTAGPRSPPTKTATTLNPLNTMPATGLTTYPQAPLWNNGIVHPGQISPYLNLLHSGPTPAINYYALTPPPVLPASSSVTPTVAPASNFTSGGGYGQLSNGMGALGGAPAAFGGGLPMQGGMAGHPNPVNFWQYNNTTGAMPTVRTVPIYNTFGQIAPASQPLVGATTPTDQAMLLKLGIVNREYKQEAIRAQIDFDSTLDRNTQLLARLVETDRKLSALQGDRAARFLQNGANPPPDDIHGKVVDVDDATGWVRINLGSDSGIVPNNTLEVYRLRPRPAYVGMLRVSDVQPNEAVGKLIGTGLRGRIQKDDEIASRIDAGPDQPSQPATSVKGSNRDWFASAPSRPSLLYKPPSFPFDERYFIDLLAHAPAMNTRSADIQAVLESEARPDLAAFPGTVDPAAARLIEQARATTWQRVTVADSGWDKGYTLICNGAGQFRYERILPDGLREIGVCDGKTLLHLYPELGVGARRESSRFHRAEFIELVPWMLPPVEDLARGRDIKLLDASTVRLVPHPSDNRTWIETHLVFSYGWLHERRWIEMPSNKMLAQEIYATDGTVKRLGPDSKVTAEQKLNRQPAEAPSLSPDTKALVVMPFPLRNGATAHRLFNPGSKSYAQLDETAALALLGTAIAEQDFARAESIYSERFRQKKDRRVGFVTLLSAFGPDAASMPQWKTIVAEHSGQPLAKYLARLTDRQRPADAPVLEIGAAANGFVPSLAEFHDHYLMWKSGKALKGNEAEKSVRRDRALDFVRRTSSPIHGWTLLVLLREKLAADVGSRKALTEALRPFEQVPALSYAARYETARDRLTDGQRAAARDQFVSLYESARQDATLPALDAAFRLALKSDDTYPLDLFGSLMRETANRRMALGQRRTVIALAWQCRQLDDRDLADELCELALSDIPEAQRLPTTLALVSSLWQTGQQERADQLLQELLADERFGKEPSLWRLASQVAAQRKSLKRSMEYLDTALEMEYRHLPDVINLAQVRSDYGRLLTGYKQLAAAMNVLERPATTEFVARVARAADRWRSLDSDGTAACQAAARILQSLDSPDLAWDYCTTPMGQKPNEAAPWTNLAHSLQGEGALELADRAYGQAFKAEPTNAQLLWDRAQNLHQLGKTDRANSLLHQLADGQWQPQFSGIQAEARRQLGTR